jgi:hypothetical protein
MFSGRGLVPRAARPLRDWLCEPSVSEFDPPTYVVATLRDALPRLDEAGASEERPVSTAAAQWGMGHDIRWVAAQIDTSFVARTANFNPGGTL